MWISKKEYEFLKENAEKNINAECEILRAKEKQDKAMAKVMEEYATVLEERDNLKQQLAYYKDLDADGRLKVLTVQEIYPCNDCECGWASISLNECKSCSDTCIRLKQYYNLRSKNI